MRPTIALFLLVPVLTLAQSRNVDLKAEEAAIRAIIARGERPQSTDGAVTCSFEPSGDSSRTNVAKACRKECG